MSSNETISFFVEKEYYCSLEKGNVAYNWAIYITMCFVSNCRLLLWCFIIIQCYNGKWRCLHCRNNAIWHYEKGNRKFL